MLADDTPCHQCGYNLRGLADDGRCPECAAVISTSVAIVNAAAGRFRPDLSRASAANRRSWTRGLACVIASAGVTAAVSLLPEGLRQPHLRPWPVVLGVGVVGWALTPLGIWWASPSDPAVDGADAVPRLRWAFGCILTALLPGAIGLARSTPHHDYGWTLFPCGMGLVGTAAGFHLRLRRLAQAAGAGLLAGQFAALAVLMPVATFGLCGLADTSGGSSLDQLLYGPNPAFGSAGVVVLGVGQLASQRDVAFGLVAVALPAWALAVLAALLWRLTRSAHESAGAGR